MIKIFAHLLLKLKCSIAYVVVYILLVVASSGMFSYILYKRDMADLEHIAQQSLKEVLKEQSPCLSPDFFSGKTSIMSDEGDTKHVESRLSDSIVLSEEKIDSLNSCWLRALTENRISAQTFLSILSLGSTDDFIEKEWLSLNLSLIYSTHKLSFFYIDNESEYEIRGFIIYSFYYTIRFFILFLVLVSLGVWVGYFGRLISIKAELPIEKKNDELSAISVSPILEQHVYRLKENIYYNASQRVFISKGIEIPLEGKLSNLFFEAILQVPNYILTDKSIFEICWSDNSGNSNKLQTLVSRLRKTLRQVDSDIVLERNMGSYQLKLM